MHREPHPAAAIFPMMGGESYEQLKADIREHGQREPVLVDQQGRILDGRNRYNACTELGIAPKVKVYDGPEAGVLALVVSLNLHRRHLDAGQRAMVADKLATLRDGQRPPAGIQAPAAVTQAQAAKLMKVSRDSVQKARVVREQAAPEVIAAVEAGEMSLNKATSTLPRKPEAKSAAPKLAPPSNGLQFAHMALMDLEQITFNDVERAAALAKVRAWLVAVDPEPVNAVDPETNVHPVSRTMGAIKALLVGYQNDPRAGKRGGKPGPADRKRLAFEVKSMLGQFNRGVLV